MRLMLNTIVLILLINTVAFSQESEAIIAVAKGFSASYMRGDYVAMANAYTEDAVLMSPGQDMIYGRKAIHEFWARDTLYRQVFHQSKSHKLEIIGNLGFDNGYWYSKASYDGRERPIASGKYLIIWKKNDKGEWRMYHDIWNNRASGWEEKEKMKEN